MRLCRTCALLALLFLALLDSSECLEEVVQPDKGSTVTVSTELPSAQCAVCTVSGVNNSETSCHSSLSLVPEVEVKLLFNCSQPIEDSYTVTIAHSIECTKTSCKPPAAETDPNLFKDFKRSITWNISVPERTVLTLDFPGGLKDISAGENCQDGYQYSVSTTKSDGVIKTNSYCKGGTVSNLDLLGATTVTVEVPKGEKLESAAFNVKAAPRAGRMMSVTSDTNTHITISRMVQGPDCSVCRDKAPNQQCDPKVLKLNGPRNISVEFTCLRPQDVFRVEINREFDCIKTPCSGDTIWPEFSLFPDFNRTFNWDVRVDFTRTFQLDFPEQGMRQIPNVETCPDEHTYSLIIYPRTGPATIGTFCRGGTVTTVQARFKGRLAVQVPVNTKLDPFEFKLSVGPVTNMSAIVRVDLTRGVSDTKFMTANYPGDFPNKMQMQWNFTVPSMHNYTVHFNDYTAPECLNNEEVMVEYQEEAKTETKLLTDPQPQQQQGNFNMVLKNCETNRTLPGLTLNYGVSVMRSGHPVLCTVDLPKQTGVSLQIEKVQSDSYCEMSINSEVKEKINVAPGTIAKLSFLDCPDEDLLLTASRVIECENMESCPMTTLDVPTLESSLPVPLHSFTWHLYIPENKTWDLVAPAGNLQQSLPGQECSEPFSLYVAEGSDHFIGNFCFGGIDGIEKVQVHANVSIVAPGRHLTRTTGPFLNVSVSQEIVETVIYTVKPNTMSPTLLATPNWPQGMKPHEATVTWIVTLPSQYKALLHFNVSQPECKMGHTGIKVMMLEKTKLLLNSREDQTVEDKLVPHSFYLNMSGCEPETGHFGVLTTIVLQKKTHLLAILLGIAGVLFLLLIVLAVVCIITKKKKKQRMNRGSSIYMPKGNIFRPSDMHFTKTRSDNESHVYESIDDTRVYSHLLDDSSYAETFQDRYNGIQVDSYHTFTGPTDATLPVIKEPDPEPKDQNKTFMDPPETFIPSRPRTPINRQDSLGFQDRRMVDNELYTFKNTGEINTIRLSGGDQESEPQITEESL